MASTRNKNDRGNYKSEEMGRQDQRLYLAFENQGNGKAYTNHFAGDGLLMGQMGPSVLSHNYADIDSYLKGIGSTNLVSTLPEIKPRIKELESVSIINKIPLIIPRDLRVDKNQRPMLS
jgi:hypothetical protein